MNSKKPIALSELFLVITMSIIFALFQAEPVTAAPVCCQKTVNGDTCQYVDSGACAPDSLAAPTSCDATSFCKPGTCIDTQGDGYCYANTPKATCDLDFKGKYHTQPTTQVPQCSLGCCILGTQAFLSNEARCKTATAAYPELSMDFRNDITTEQACTDLARSGEQGCCVQGPNSCSYGAKSTCTAPRGDGTGFFKDQACSQISGCQCTPSNPSLPNGNGNPKSTMCLPGHDEVYWKDSCGNPEGIKEKCDFTKGTICGDSDRNGAYTCESLDCRGTEQKPLSLTLTNKQGTTSALTKDFLRNGESFCLYDAASQGVKGPKELDTVGTRSPVGSRYNRGVCINGQEIIEPCADFRQEFCVSGTMENTALDEQLSAARCIPNEWESCIDQCNTANAYTQDESTYKENAKNDKLCCQDISKRDCSWIGNDDGGRCIPKVGPGAKFWEDENVGTCAKANMECPVVLVCPGTSAWTGTCEIANDEEWDHWITAAKVAGGAALGALIVVGTGGTFGAYALPVFFSAADVWIKELEKNSENRQGWHVVSGRECLSKEYLIAANNICRSFGDCGANINYDNAVSLTGFKNTNLAKEFENGGMLETPTLPEKHANIPITSDNYVDIEKVNGNPGSLNDVDKNPTTITEKDLDWERGKTFFDFTLKEDLSFGERFEQRYGEWGWQLIVTSGITWLGAPTAGFIATDYSAAGLVAGGGPLGRLVNFVGGIIGQIGGAKGYEAAVNEAGEKLKGAIALDTTREAAAEKARDAFAKKVTDGLTKETEELATKGLKLSPEQIEQTINRQVAAELKEQAAAKSLQKSNEPLGISPPPSELVLDKTVLEESAKRGFEAGKKAIEAGKTPDQINAAIQEATKEGLEAGAPPSPVSEGWAQASNALSVAAWVDLIYEGIDLFGQEQQVKKIATTCSPWVPPAQKPEQCEQCNPDLAAYNKNGKPTNVRALLPCTEYRCKSLGATCDFINQGTDDERCVSTSKYDAAPPVINVWNEGFDTAYKTEKIPSVNGIHVKNKTGSGDIPVYQKILLALKTDQPAQCKMNFTPGKRYKEMEPFYFGTPTYKTFHQQTIFWPGQANITDSKLTISKGNQTYKLYVRCENPKGVADESDFVIQFKVSKEPDLTAPQILTTSYLGQDHYLSANQNKTDVTLFLNEPAECKWGLSPQNYDDMPAINKCSIQNPNRYGDYECNFKSTGGGTVGPAISVQTPKAGTTAFVYFKCKDFAAPKQNTMTEPYKLTLHGSDPLEITSIMPAGDIYTSLTIENVTLSVATSGGAFLDGKAECRYTQQESNKNKYQAMKDTPFLNTHTSTHTQPLILPTGDQTFYVGCADAAGNTAFAETSFHVLADIHSPQILKAYKTDQPRMFNVIVNEDAQCVFSTTKQNFAYDEGSVMIKDGNVHSTTDDANRYYIRCKDNYQNTNTAPLTITFL